MRSVFVTTLLLAACAPEAPDATPSGAVRAFLDAARHASDEVGARDRLVGLLDRSSRRHLERKALEASALSAGREFRAWEMIARDGIHVELDGTDARCTERIQGDRANVRCTGNGREDAYEFTAVREGEAWRVVANVGE